MTPVVTFGPGRTVYLDDEFHDSVRRCAALRQRLKLAAETTAKQRGHNLALWSSTDIDHYTTHCINCGAGVTVETSWPEITGSATGAALTGDCVQQQ